MTTAEADEINESVVLYKKLRQFFKQKASVAKCAKCRKRFLTMALMYETKLEQIDLLQQAGKDAR